MITLEFKKANAIKDFIAIAEIKNGFIDEMNHLLTGELEKVDVALAKKAFGASEVTMVYSQFSASKILEIKYLNEDSFYPTNVVYDLVLFNQNRLKNYRCNRSSEL